MCVLSAVCLCVCVCGKGNLQSLAYKNSTQGAINSIKSILYRLSRPSVLFHVLQGLINTAGGHLIFFNFKCQEQSLNQYCASSFHKGLNCKKDQ